MQSYIDKYLEEYLPRRKIIHRLPISVPISKVWPQIQQARKENSEALPLYTANGEPFRWVLTDTILRQSEEIISFAQNEFTYDRPEYEQALQNALLEEAVSSCSLAGTAITKGEADRFIKGEYAPQNRQERMVHNIYTALEYVHNILDSPITEKTIGSIHGLVVKDILEKGVPTEEYRNENMPPRSQDMMKSLLAFIAGEEMHPIIKACIAHYYFIYIHPFHAGNNRTARLLTYLILLQAGYGFFRYFSISNAIARERSKYEAAIQDVQEDAFDLTYFIEYYTGILAYAVREMECSLVDRVRIEQKLESMEDAGIHARIVAGIEGMLIGQDHSLTIKEWQKKFGVSTETARQDLLKLESLGMVKRKRIRGRYEYEAVRII